MGTRADFYVGRGLTAAWIGSIAWDGNPESIDAQILNCTSEAAFRHAVAGFLKDRDDKTLPEQGWPWPWQNSQTTDYAYAFEGEKVYASSFGYDWFDPTKEQTEDDHEERDAKGKVAVFPDMSAAKQREKFGAHSGVIVLGMRS